MSSRGADAFNEWYDDYKHEVLEGYLEVEKGWETFIAWLVTQESTMTALKELFLATDSPERKRFEAYAEAHYESIGPDEDQGRDR